VGPRLTAVALILGAATADAAGAHGLAFYLLLAAVVACAVAALGSLTAVLDRPNEVVTLQAILWGLCLLFVVVGCAARSPAVQAGEVPRPAVSALSAALVVLAVKSSLWAWTIVRPRLVARIVARA
jgi:hypothetical protein